MVTIVLVHGAWHGAWCWRHVVPRLEQQGHRVLAPDLPGHGDDPESPHTQTLSRYVRRILSVVADVDGPVVLVGHSLAGLVISAVAEALPTRVARLIFVSALLPRDGDSLVRICSADPENPMNTATVRTPEQKSQTVDPARLQQVFYPDCPAADVALARQRLGPEPLATMFNTVRVTPERFGTVARSYIYCVHDVALPLFLQEQMVADSPCESVVRLDCGHSPFFAVPDQLASAINTLVRDL
ncbi:MAG: alpha/beta fold hydrolase [Gammaproteobacteria bacterium]